MPTYLCHGFRWHRRDIRIFVILNDIEDAAPNWVIAPATSASILSQFYASYDFLPKPAPPTPPSERDGNSRRVVKAGEDQHEHIDDDHSLPPPRVPPSQDGVLMHSWSAVRVLEEFDPDEMTVPCRPYAYVADYVVRVDLSVDVAGEMAKYYDKMIRDDAWIVRLRDELQKGEPVRWYIVVCGDEVREVPCESDYGDSDEEEYDYDDDDEVLTVLEDIAEEPAGASTPRPLDQEEPDVDRPLQPEDLVPQRSSTSTSSSSWPLSEGSPSVPPRLPTPDVDVPLLQADDIITPRYSTSTTSWLYEDDDEPPGQHHLMLKPEEFAKAQSPARSPIPEDPPDVVMPLRPEELAPPRSPSPMTPSPVQQELSGLSLHSPEESLPPRSPSPMSPNLSQQEQLDSKFSYTPEENISLRSPSPMATNPAQQDLLGSELHSQEEISPPRSPSPMSSPPIQQELLGSAPNRPRDIMPPRTPSPISPAARPPSPPTPRQTQFVAREISVQDSRDPISAPSSSPTTPTLVQKETSDARLSTHSRDSLARSPSPMSHWRIPRETPRLGVPPPPEPAETVVVVPPPTPPKPRPIQEESLVPEPEEPLEAAVKIKAPPSTPMVHHGEAEDSGAELEGEEVIPEPPPTPASDYDWDAESEQSQSLEDEEGVRAPPPTRVQTRQASVSTQHSDVYKPDGYRQQRVNRRQSVAEGLKRLFKRQH
ncbi:hypothetical protein ACJZ2D_010894 [Fusarium nematophilum]